MAAGTNHIADYCGSSCLFIKIGYLEPMLFICEAPFIPIPVFILAIFGFVGVAYYLGARNVLRSDLIDALRDDTEM